MQHFYEMQNCGSYTIRYLKIEISLLRERVKNGMENLLGMIQQLPPSYWMVLNPYVFEGMKHREIAEHPGISEGTSKSNLLVARGILQNRVNISSRKPELKCI